MTPSGTAMGFGMSAGFLGKGSCRAYSKGPMPGQLAAVKFFSIDAGSYRTGEEVRPSLLW